MLSMRIYVYDVRHISVTGFLRHANRVVMCTPNSCVHNHTIGCNQNGKNLSENGEVFILNKQKAQYYWTFRAFALVSKARSLGERVRLHTYDTITRLQLSVW